MKTVRFSLVLIMLVSLIPACNRNSSGPTYVWPTVARPTLAFVEPTGSGAAAPATASRGATLPYIEYEAEDGVTTGAVLGPTRTFGEVAAEASGRKAVRLDTNGQYVEFTATKAANSIVIRHNIPDAPQGGGILASVSLYIDGVHRQDIMLSSKQAWLYGGAEGYSNDPATGSPHRFFDENRALVGDIPAGATVRLQKDSGDAADYYILDLVDLEQVAPPIAMPDGSVSITDYGATPNDGTDDTNAIYDAIHAAKAEGKDVWIPAGTFTKTGGPVVKNTHRGYSGSGYVTGYDYYGARTALYPSIAAAGDYPLTLRYSNGTGNAQTLGLYIQGVRTQITLPPTANWDTWANYEQTTAIPSSGPEIEFIRSYEDSGQVNLDYMILDGKKYEAETGKMVCPIYVDHVTIRGAGMWYSNISGYFAAFVTQGNNSKFENFAVTGDTVNRDDMLPDNAFSGGPGTGSELRNIWVEHTKVGYWVGHDRSATPADGLLITGSRFRDLFADGVNFSHGTRNSTIEQSHFRNTGDDAIAAWARKTPGAVNANNTIRFNTVQVPWRANCFALYGGKDSTIEDNLCYDTTTYPGILVATSFDAYPLTGTTTIQRNSLIRAGGPMWGNPYGALMIRAEQQDIANLVIRDIDIQDATYSGIEFSGPKTMSNVTLDKININGAGKYGVYATGDARGSVTFTNFTLKDAAGGEVNNLAEKAFTIQGVGVQPEADNRKPAAGTDPTLIEDFNSGLPTSGGFTFSRDESDPAGRLAVTALAADLPVEPAIPDNKALSVDFSNTGQGGFIENTFQPDQTGWKDWSAYQGVSFWFNGSNSGGKVIFQLKCDGDSQKASNRYGYAFSDNVNGWRLFLLPWSAFTGASGGRPDALINPAKVWGYEISLPPGSAAFKIDEIRLMGSQMVADFNPGLPRDGLFANGRDTSDPAGHLAVTAQASDVPVAPAIPDNQALSVDFANTGWGGFVEYGYQPDLTGWKDWSAFQGVSFWLKGTNSGGEIKFQLKSDGDNQQISNRYEYSFTDNVNGWRLFQLAWSTFIKGSGYNPGPNPDAPINPARMWGYAFILPAGTTVFSADQISVYGGKNDTVSAGAQVGATATPVTPTITDNKEPPDIRVYDDLENGAWTAPTAFGVMLGYTMWWDPDAGTATSVTTVPAAGELAVPGQKDGNHILAFTYQSSRWGGLTYTPRDGNNWPSQDWTRYDGILFWLYGNNTQGIIHFEIFDNRTLGSTGDTAERYYYEFPDNYSGWKHISIPFSAFVRRTNYQPTGAPDDGFNLTDVSGYAIGFPTGIGSPRTAYLDQVEMYGDLSSTQPVIRAEFNDYAYGVVEGSPLTVKVTLNIAAAAPVILSYSMTAGTAKPGPDYIASTATLTIPAGQTSTTFTVQTVDDSVDEPDKQFELHLSDPSGAAIGAKGMAVVVVQDNDESAAAPSDPALIDAFEDGLPTGLTASPSYNIQTVIALNALPLVPSLPSNHVLEVAYTTPEGRILNRSLSTAKDWTQYQGIGFWFYGGSSEATIGFEITLADFVAASSFVDSFSGWRLINLAWPSFVYQSADGSRQNLSLSPARQKAGQFLGYAFKLPPGAGTFQLDQVTLVGNTVVDDFETNIPPGLAAYTMPSSAGSVTFSRTVMELPGIPGGATNTALTANYNVGGFGGGITRDFTTEQDWSGSQGFSLWFYGSNTGNPIHIELKTAGSGPDSANRYETIITDDFAGWRLLQVPWAQFTKRTSFNPGPNPDAPIAPAHGWGYSIIAPLGTGSFSIDEVGLYSGARK